MKIKVKVLNEKCMPKISKNGDWIDLKSSKDITIEAAQSGVLKRDHNNSHRNVNTPVYYIPLGVAIQLPSGYEAVINARSSNPKNGLFIPNGQGVIDNSYCGDSDEWKFVCSPLFSTEIKEGQRICQFRVQLSQKATFWQKLKWLFSSKIELEQVKTLNNPNRGGFGSTGK